VRTFLAAAATAAVVGASALGAHAGPIGDTVTAFTGKTVPVTCGRMYLKTSAAETWGIAPDTSPLRIVLLPQVCRGLKGRDPFAVAVLAHEMGHVALLTRDEHAADCWGRRVVGRLGVQYGLGPYRRSQARAYLPC